MAGTQMSQDLQSMPFGTMIGAPLSACIDAQEKAALTTIKFIQNVGFVKEGNKITDKVVNVTFKYERDGNEVKLSVPLLTIVPIPYIAINEVNINFKASLNSVSSTDYENTSNSDSGWSYAYDGKKVDYNASVSTKKDSKATQNSQYSVEATIDINVIARQDSMPAGLAKVLEMLNQSIFLDTDSKK